MAGTPHESIAMNRRQLLAGLFGLGSALAAGCGAGRNFTLLGSTPEPNYDPDIRTVYVPIFKTKVLETTPYRGMEFTLTRQVIAEIEQTTPFKVVSDPDRADTELQGTVVALRKTLLNRTPFNEARDIELAISVEIVWHDLRPGHEGKILTNPQPKKSQIDSGEIPFDPVNPPTPEGPQKPRPVMITDRGRVVAELGETSTTGLDQAMKRVAIKIVSAMERPF